MSGASASSSMTPRAPSGTAARATTTRCTSRQSWYYEVVEPRDGYAVRADVRHDYEREGERLAQALASEVGHPFSVSVIHPTRGSGSRTYRSSSAPTNFEAHAAFVVLHDEVSEVDR
jgi:hypothetical protein